MDNLNRAALVRLLGRLVGENIFIHRCRNGDVQIVRIDRGQVETVTKLNAPVLEVLLRQELLRPVMRPDADGAEAYFQISQFGHARFRRHLAQGEGAFRKQHMTVAAEEASTGAVRHRNQSESPLEWLYKRRGKNGKSFISKDQFDAGERLRRDFTFAQLEPRVTSSWNPERRTGPSAFAGSAEISDRVIAAKQRFYHALDRVGPGLGDVLVEVCCHLTGLAEAERKLDWPVRSGKIVLAIALDQLARHYGMVASGPAYGRIQGGLSGVDENRNKILD